jgi:hypothetical protein
VARTCTIYAHPKLVNIDRQLLRGDMLNGTPVPRVAGRGGTPSPPHANGDAEGAGGV